MTDTPAFRDWFGNSKVVDEDGRPLAVYHGTMNGGFTSFELYDTADGIYFTDSIDTATSYSGDERVLRAGVDQGPGLYKSYLRIEDPLVVNFNGNHYDGLIEDGNNNRWSKRTLDRAVERARRLGKDGVVAKDVISQGPEGHLYLGRDPVTVYVVFDPKQIKDSSGNIGTFELELGRRHRRLA